MRLGLESGAYLAGVLGYILRWDDLDVFRVWFTIEIIVVLVLGPRGVGGFK